MRKKFTRMPKTSYLDLLCTSNLIHFFETNKFWRWCMPSSIMMMPFTTFVMISIYRDCGILCETRGHHDVSWQSSFIYSQKFSAVFFSYFPFYQHAVRRLRTKIIQSKKLSWFPIRLQISVFSIWKLKRNMNWV